MLQYVLAIGHVRCVIHDIRENFWDVAFVAHRPRHDTFNLMEGGIMSFFGYMFLWAILAGVGIIMKKSALKSVFIGFVVASLFLAVTAPKKDAQIPPKPEKQVAQKQETKTGSQPQKSERPAPATPPASAQIPGYRITDVNDTSYAGNRRVVYRVYINTHQTPDQSTMEAVAKEVWEKNKGSWNEFTVFMIFGPITDFSAGAYGIANFGRRGMTGYQTNPVPLQILDLGEKFPESVEIKPIPEPWKIEDNTSEASVMARDLVRARLVAPSTAKFPGTMTMLQQTTKIGERKYRIRSYVDAQNRFGAMVRINYIAEIEQTGPELHSGHWRLTSFRETE